MREILRSIKTIVLPFFLFSFITNTTFSTISPEGNEVRKITNFARNLGFNKTSQLSEFIKSSTGKTWTKVKVTGKALRKSYVREVDNLNKIAKTMKSAGKSPEVVARTISKMRRELGKKYKAITPQKFLDEIFARNMKKGGDKWGPTVEYLRKEKGYTWKEIIESSSKPGGKDFGL